MADEAGLRMAKMALAHLEGGGRHYRDGVLDAVAECYEQMRGQPKHAIIDAVSAQFKAYELDRLEVWQAHGLAVVEDMRAHG